MTGVVLGGGLAIAFAGHPVLRRVERRYDHHAVLPDDETLRGDLLKWLVTTVLLAYVTVVEGGSIGVRAADALPVAGGLDGVASLVGWWVAGVLGVIVLSTVVYNLFRYLQLGTQDEFAAEQADRPVSAFVFTAITAGVTESVLFQGYPIPRLAAATGSLVLAGLIAWVAFAAVHYVSGRFTVDETVFTSAPALVVTVLFVLSGSLAVVVLVHTTVNLLSVLQR